MASRGGRDEHRRPTRPFELTGLPMVELGPRCLEASPKAAVMASVALDRRCRARSSTPAVRRTDRRRAVGVPAGELLNVGLPDKLHACPIQC